MIRVLFYTAIIILISSTSFGQETRLNIQGEEQETKSTTEEKKQEKPKREPIVDTFTRIDQGDGGVDALVIYAHPFYFTYKGFFEEANKKYGMEKFHVFIVTINSQKKDDLSKFKVSSSVFLRTEDGLEYPAVPQWLPLTETTSKRTGIIRFFQVDAKGNKLLKDDAKSFEIVIKGLADVPERTFKWKLPIEF